MPVKVGIPQVLHRVDVSQESRTLLFLLKTKNCLLFGLLFLFFLLLTQLLLQYLIDLLTLILTCGFLNAMTVISGMTLTMTRPDGLVLLAQLLTVPSALQTLFVMNVKKESCSRLTSQSVLISLTVLFLHTFNLQDLRKETVNGFALNAISDSTTLKMTEVKKLAASHVLKTLTQTAEPVE